MISYSRDAKDERFKVTGEEVESTEYCNKHSEPMPLFPSTIFGNVIVGYYCIGCRDFIPKAIVPEVDMIKKLMERCRGGIVERRKLECVQ
ncbi:MAG: hypothetical protein HMLIMOIP_001191 [Candidatus Nitrosomirales archaeon]